MQPVLLRLYPVCALSNITIKSSLSLQIFQKLSGLRTNGSPRAVRPSAASLSALCKYSQIECLCKSMWIGCSLDIENIVNRWRRGCVLPLQWSREFRRKKCIQLPWQVYMEADCLHGLEGHRAWLHSCLRPQDTRTGTACHKDLNGWKLKDSLCVLWLVLPVNYFPKTIQEWRK